MPKLRTQPLPRFRTHAKGCHRRIQVLSSLFPSGNRLGQTALLMRTTSRFLTEYREEYLYSLRLFWPWRHLFQLVVLDEERAEDQAAAPALRDELAGLGTRGEVLFEPDNDWRRTPGHTCVGLTAHASFS